MPKSKGGGGGGNKGSQQSVKKQHMPCAAPKSSNKGSGPQSTAKRPVSAPCKGKAVASANPCARPSTSNSKANKGVRQFIDSQVKPDGKSSKVQRGIYYLFINN